MTRKEFELSPTKIHPVDGMNYKPSAQPDCKTCNGMGIIEDGKFDFACVLIICPDCWQPKGEKQ